jgi:hypothetical protein
VYLDYHTTLEMIEQLVVLDLDRPVADVASPLVPFSTLW